MSIDMAPAQPRKDHIAAVTPLIKAIAAALPGIIAHDPSTIASLASNTLPHIIDTAFSVSKCPEGDLSSTAWNIVRGAYASALLRVFNLIKLDRTPSSSELHDLTQRLVIKADLIGEQSRQQLNIDHLAAPMKISILRMAAKDLPHELSFFGFSSSHTTPGQIRIVFERCLFDGLKDVRNSRPQAFVLLENALTGSVSQIEERRTAYGLHQQHLISSFTLSPIFGQEDTGIALSDLYVRQRCLWTTYEELVSEVRSDEPSKNSGQVLKAAMFSNQKGRLKKTSHLHLDGLHESLHEWLDNVSRSDAVRVVAGGPGSGKSTFAKAFAVEVLDRDNFDILFVPLQDIEASGSFESRIASLCRNRTELGFDRVPSPLNWLGCRESDGSPPSKPLLIICDGLDEIAPPDSKDANTITADFIQVMSQWLQNRNSGGLYTCAIILGRTIAAEEAFRKLSMDHTGLLRVAGLLPLPLTSEWHLATQRNLAHDPRGLAIKDQRVEYWHGWRKVKNIASDALPMALNTEGGVDTAVQELTTEPLLLYLLLWTNYIGDKWHLAVDNRNVIYKEIFYRIYRRDWGQPHASPSTRRNFEKGGHTGTESLSIEDFERYQEALGLASWPSGGRTISTKVFSSVLQQFLTGDELADFNANPSLNLKSIALQSYTRSGESGEEGYEFVHKTLGEYLISRALIRVVLRACNELSERTNDTRCRNAASFICKIAGGGKFTNEIFKFFNDEIRLQYRDAGMGSDGTAEHITTLINWILRNGFPLHDQQNAHVVNFKSLQHLHRCSLDVLWSFSQCLFHNLNRNLPRDGRNPDFKLSSIDIEWPSTNSFSSLFFEICDRTYTSETRRMTTFDNLDLTDQSLGEISYGSIVTEEASILMWIGFQARDTNFAQCEFYGSDLGQGYFQGSNFSEAHLQTADMTRSQFQYCDFRNARMSLADLSGSSFDSSNLSDAQLAGCNLSSANFGSACLVGAKFSYLNNLVLPFQAIRQSLVQGTNFENADLQGVDFFGCELVKANFKDANLKQSILLYAINRESDFTGADLSGAKLSRYIFESMSLSEAQRASVLVIENEDLDDAQCEVYGKNFPRILGF